MCIVKQSEALRRRRKLVENLPSADEILRGSLLERTIRHKKGCAKCAAGGGHPVWVLSIGYPGGITKQYSIRREMKPQVEQWLELPGTESQIGRDLRVEPRADSARGVVPFHLLH